MPHKILIDTDPGLDDAIAILAALGSPEDVTVLGLATVCGNVGVDLTTANALRVLELAGHAQVPVHPGCARPLLEPLATAERVHGMTGLDGADLPAPRTAPRSQHAVDWIVETLLAEPAGTVTVCTLGPQTNLALAIVKEPAIVPRIARVVMMGGAYFAGGNSTPAAEFNLMVDPHAAYIVLGSGVPIVMFPLDLTHTTRTTKARLAAFGAIGGGIGAAAEGWLSHYGGFDIAKYGMDGGPLHDPNVIAYLIRPELYETRHVAVQVSLADPLTKGMTVMDWWGVTGRAPNVHVAHKADAEGYYALLTERLGRLAR